MKAAAVVAMVIGMAFGVLAQDANLLTKNWRFYGDKANTVIDAKSGEIACVAKGAKSMSGVLQGIKLNQTAAKAITFSAESKADKVTGNVNGNYGLYLDITLADGSKVWGRVANFKGGTHDWEKTQATYTPAKPIKEINFYVLLRNVTGTASFRNITLTQAK